MTKKERNCEYMRKYRKTEKNRIYKREYMRKWRAKNGNYRDTMRKRVLYNVDRGYIKRLPCEVCGEIEVEIHHDDYRSPEKIIFLCQTHHRERDVAMGKRKS